MEKVKPEPTWGQLLRQLGAVLGVCREPVPERTPYDGHFDLLDPRLTRALYKERVRRRGFRPTRATYRGKEYAIKYVFRGSVCLYSDPKKKDTFHAPTAEVQIIPWAPCEILP